MIVHFYLATLGHTPMAHIIAMFKGYEEIHEESDTVMMRDVVTAAGMKKHGDTHTKNTATNKYCI